MKGITVIFIFSSKKVAERFGWLVKLPYLCTRFREATGVRSPDAFLCSLFGRVARSLTDCEQEVTRQAAHAHVHVIYMCVHAEASSHSFNTKQRTMEQEEPGRSDGTIMKFLLQ